MHRLAICATIRDEARDLREWVVFHRLMGVEHFWLYDNFSRDKPEQVLAAEIAEGVVEIRPWHVPFQSGGQRRAYQHCLETHRDQTRWLAFFDLDEFLFSPTGASLPKTLERFAAHPGVAVNWLGFGSSGRDEREGLLVLEAFTRRAPTRWIRNHRVKCVVQPARTEHIQSVHGCVYRDGALAVNGSGAPVRLVYRTRARRRWRRWLSTVFPSGPFDPRAVWELEPKGVHVEQLVIHHYLTRSRGEFAAKRARYEAPRPGLRPVRNRIDARYFRVHDRNDVEDGTLARFAPQLRAILGLPARPER